MKIKFLPLILPMLFTVVSCGPNQDPSEPSTPSELPEDIVDIEITRMPTKVRYIVGADMDYSDMVVSAIQRNGEKVVLSDYTYDTSSLSELGQKEIKISYLTDEGDKLSTTFKVNVVEALKYNPSNVTETHQVELKSKFVAKTYVYSSNYTLNYRIFEPTDSVLEKLPLVIMLHGAGERGSDNLLQLKNSFYLPFARGDSLFYDAICVAPQCPVAPAQWVQTPWGNGNYNLSSVPESDQLKAVHSLIDTLKSSKNIDTSRIYVTGISMGGFGTWDLISRHFDTFAAAAPICGGGPEDKFELLSNMPIITFHGDADGSVPYAGTKAMVDGINEYGKNNIKFITFPGAGHGIWDKAFNHDNYILERFLFSKTK